VVLTDWLVWLVVVWCRVVWCRVLMYWVIDRLGYLMVSVRLVLRLLFGWRWWWSGALLADEGAWAGAVYVVVGVVAMVVVMVVVNVLIGVTAEVLLEVDGGTVWALHYHWYILDVAMLIIPWFVAVVASHVRTLIVVVREKLTILRTLFVRCQCQCQKGGYNC